MSNEASTYTGEERRSEESQSIRNKIAKLRESSEGAKKALNKTRYEFAELIESIVVSKEMTLERAAGIHKELDTLEELEFIEGMSTKIHDMHVTIDAILERESDGSETFKHNHLKLGDEPKEA